MLQATYQVTTAGTVVPEGKTLARVAAAVLTPKVLGKSKDVSGLGMFDRTNRALLANPHVRIVGYGESATHYFTFYQRQQLLLAPVASRRDV